MGFFRQEFWSVLPFPPAGNLPNPGIKTLSPGLPVLLVHSYPLSHWEENNDSLFQFLLLFCVFIGKNTVIW